MVNKLCGNYEIPSMQCKLFNPNRCWDGFVFNSNGHCNYPFILKPKKDTCKYFRVSAQDKNRLDNASNNMASMQVTLKDRTDEA